MKRFTIIIASLLLSIASTAQTRWLNPIAEGAEVHGQGWSELRGTYNRLPAKAQATVRKDVWGLSRSAAGLSIAFRSDAKTLSVRYQVEGGHAMFHMPSTGKSGVDLYAWGEDGKMRWCAEDFTPSFQDTIVYRYSNITHYPEGSKEYEYRLYLPPYNNVEWLEIGVPEDANITFEKESTERPIVVYGTSIAQGACASRPGMMWSNILDRELGHPVINLGFSGNGRLEPEVFDLLAEINARVYLIDCLPNMGAKNPIKDLVKDGVRRLREANPDCVIVLVDHSGYPGEDANVNRSSYRETNALQQEAYRELKKNGVKNLYYLTKEEIGLGIDDTVESVHPNDLGMRHYADAYEKLLRKIYRKF